MARQARSVNSGRRPRERWLYLTALVLIASVVAHASGTSPATVSVERYGNGRMKRVAEYKDGRLEGVVRGWYESGSVEYERNYREGREEGAHRGWYENGAPKFEYHFHDGVSEGVQRQWYPNGAPLTVLKHLHGIEIGRQAMWNADGSIRSNYVIRDGKRYGLLGAMGCTGRRRSEEKPEK